MRYGCQTSLDAIGQKGQERIEDSEVAIVGAGALGTVAAEQLVRAGLGKLTILDYDVVELQNLQRQLLYTEKDVGKPKIDSLCRHLRNINSDIEIIGKDMHVTEESNLPECLILDCTDNFETSRIINRWCINHSLSWVHASAAGVRGLVVPFLAGRYCFECVFGDRPTHETAATSGILNSGTSMIASIQVVQALKLLLGENTDTMQIINAWEPSLRLFRLKVKEGCICQKRHA